MEGTRGWLSQCQGQQLSARIVLPSVIPANQVSGWVCVRLSSQGRRGVFREAETPVGFASSTHHLSGSSGYWTNGYFPGSCWAGPGLRSGSPCGHQCRWLCGYLLLPAATVFLEAVAFVSQFNIVETLPRLLKMKQKCSQAEFHYPKY